MKTGEGLTKKLAKLILLRIKQERKNGEQARFNGAHSVFLHEKDHVEAEFEHREFYHHKCSTFTECSYVLWKEQGNDPRAYTFDRKDSSGKPYNGGILCRAEFSSNLNPGAYEFLLTRAWDNVLIKRNLTDNMELSATTNLNENLNNKIWSMCKKIKTHSSQLQDFHIKRHITTYNMGHQAGSLYHSLGCMTEQNKKMLSYKDHTQLKKGKQKPCRNIAARKNAFRDQFNNPGYSGGQGDFMPPLPGANNGAEPGENVAEPGANVAEPGENVADDPPPLPVANSGPIQFDGQTPSCSGWKAK